MSRVLPAIRNDFSISQARGIIGDLMSPDSRIYWADFLATILSGHFLAAYVRSPESIVPHDLQNAASLSFARVVCFVISSLLYYRAAIFIHELVHLPRGEFKAFRFAWNLLAGIPFLTPSFVYDTHLDHHRRKHFGTEHDGEYIPLGLRGRRAVIAYLALSPLIPIAAFLRFALLTPLTWFHPSLKSWIYRHASSLVMDPAYLRPADSARRMMTIRLQETLCFLACWAYVFVPLLRGRDPLSLLLQIYCTGTFIVTLNALRTLGSHRWNHEHEELDFTQQLLDSVNIETAGFCGELWGPLGTRFHALHHLFPTLPYHNLAIAHRRLMSALPADSPYRRTVEPSLRAALADLWERAGNADAAQSASDITHLRDYSHAA